MRFYTGEQPRAVIVGWDSVEAPTKRREMFPAYQSGRQFDDELIEQLNVLPELSQLAGLQTPKQQGSRRTIFWPRRLPPRSARAAPR
jgi:DNA polymerase-1